MRKLAFVTALALLFAPGLPAQILSSMPPSGDNQHAVVTQYVGPVSITVDYHSPRVVRGTNDRRGKIWGDLVPYGLTDLGYGPCRQCPWRGGANENTTFAVSHEVNVQGQKLPAGTYGLFFIPDPGEWTVIFSKNSTSWGAFSYDPAEDALRVKAKPVKSEYHEWLSYEFTDRSVDHAVLSLEWENLALPVEIAVPDINDLYLAAMKNELRNSTGFVPQNWATAARWALQNKYYDDALQLATVGVNGQRGGQSGESFQSLAVLAEAQEAKGMTAEAAATRAKALASPTATAIDLHQYARILLQKGNKDEAVRVWMMNAKLHPNVWPVNVGLMRAYSAQGKYKDALKYAKLAVSQAPDEMNRKNLEASVKKLEGGQDVN